MMQLNGKSPFTFEEIREDCFHDLAVMVSARVKRQRKAVPVLSSRCEMPESVMPLLSDLVHRGSGLMALEDGKPVGFLIGWLIETFMGTQNGVFIPETGFGTDSADPRRNIRIFDALYAALCPAWCPAGWLSHAISTYEEEREFREHLFHQGFGGVCMDAVRPAVAMNLQIPADLLIREVKIGDDPAVMAWLELSNLQSAHMRSAPVYLGSAPESHDAAELREWLAQESHYVWIAERLSDGMAVGTLQLERETDGTSFLVRDPRNMAVTGAFTRPETRGNGIATLLLDAAIKKASSCGMTRVSVDFETRNTPAMAFWTRHFTPFTFSVIRCVDGRLFQKGGEA